jgi:hypothetical protein
VAVALVVAIVVVAVDRVDRERADRAGRGGSTVPAGGAGSTSGRSIDPCLVGTWRTILDSQQLTVDGVGPVVVSGQGVVLHIGPDGSGVQDYSAATPYEGTADDHQVRVTVTGTVRATIRTGGGTMSFQGVTADGTVTTAIDGTGLHPVPLTAGTDPVSYTCSGDGATEHTARYDVRLVRISTSP